MIEDVFAVMNRITEIKKRFGSMRHNTPEPAKVNPKNFSDTLAGLDDEGDTGVPEKGRTPTVNDIKAMADHYAKKSNVPAGLVKAVIENESGYNPSAVSKKGAQGLMQLMPSVSKELGVADPFDPEQNIRGGVTLLKDLLTQYHGDYKKAVAAYNAGRGAVDRSGGVPEIGETKEFVKKVINSYVKNSK